MDVNNGDTAIIKVGAWNGDHFFWLDVNYGDTAINFKVGAWNGDHSFLCLKMMFY